MARRFKPLPFNVAMRLLKPTNTIVKGVRKSVYPEDPHTGTLLFGSFRTFNGSENWSNEVYTIENTGTIDTWYNPEIKSDCRIYIEDTGEEWQIISEPEDIEMRHQFMQFKVQKVGGEP